MSGMLPPPRDRDRKDCCKVCWRSEDRGAPRSGPKRIWSCGGKPGRKANWTCCGESNVFLPSTDEDTIDLVRRPGVHHPDAIIAGVLGGQGRKPPPASVFTADKVGNLRRYWRSRATSRPPRHREGELLKACSRRGKTGRGGFDAAPLARRWFYCREQSLQALPGGYA